jgi:hypothetical protein
MDWLREHYILMAHFAQLDGNTVTQIIVVANEELMVDGVESEAKGIAFCQSLFGGEWKQTSFNGNFRKNYAGIGYTYDAVNDVFYAPQPYPSWTISAPTWVWQPPVEKPEGNYVWDEATTSWVAIAL